MKIFNNKRIINLVSIFLICFFILSKAMVYLPFLEGLKKEFLANTMYVTGIVTMIINIIIAGWLFFDARKNKQNPFIWSFLALSSGLLALFTYYWRLIYLKINENER